MQLDFSSQTAYLPALLPEIVLSLWAMLVLMVDVFQKGNRSEASRPIIPWLSLAGLGVTAVANAWMLGLEATGYGVIAVDGFRVFSNFIFLLAAALGILLSVGYLDRHDLNRGEYYVLLLYATVGMMLLGGSHDLILLFLGLELMSMAVYVLVGFNRKEPRSSEGALKYFLLGAFSSCFLLYGIALLFGATGSTNLAEIGVQAEMLGGNPMFLVGVGMLLVGLGFKIAAVPFHMWAPDAYDGAPTPITAFMATGVKAAAFAAFIRVFSVTLGPVYESWGMVLGWIAVITMFAGNLIALTQGSVKRMLAYSSIAHAGYLLVALVAANEYGASAFLFYLVVYTLMTAGAFGMVIVNNRDLLERNSLDDFAGLGWERPVLGASFTVLLLSLAGFPLTGGFIGKMYILRSSLEAGNVLLAVGLVLASAISYFYYLRVVVVMYMRPAPEGARPLLPIPAGIRLAIVGAAAAVVILFFVPQPFLQAAEQSVSAMFGPTGAFLGLLP